jgi:A/G-specific adenine glycosylase
MELGALVCKPTNPDCDVCPVQSQCYAFANGLIDLLPVRKLRSVKKVRHLNFLVFIQKQRTFIRKRKNRDIWKGLFEFPLIESADDLLTLAGSDHIAKTLSEASFIGIKRGTHLLTHQKLEISFWEFQVIGAPTAADPFVEVDIDQINHTFALPKPIENFLKHRQSAMHVSQ